MERVKWIDGMRGCACIIVFLGHSVACVFPSTFFGDSYRMHSVIEKVIHMSPLSVFINSSSMVGAFLFFSGYLISKQEKKGGIVRIVKKYLKFIPMIFIGTLIPYVVMKFDLAFHIKLAPYSYASDYVYQYNNFETCLLGREGLIVDSLICTFLSSSKYNNTLWFVKVLFWGSIVAEFMISFLKNSKVKIVSCVGLYVVCMTLGKVDWRFPYAAFIYAGMLLAMIDISKKLPSVCAYFAFAIGIYLISPVEYVGVYKPLSYFDEVGINLRIIGIALVVFSVDNSLKLKKIFSSKILQVIAHYSFGIYVIQWGVVISMTCGITYFLNTKLGMYYGVSGCLGLLGGAATTIVLSIVFTNHFYDLYCNLLDKYERKIK